MHGEIVELTQQDSVRKHPQNRATEEAAASNEGAYVFITGCRQSELDKAKAEIGRNISTVHGDVASLADLDKLYVQVKAKKPARPASTSRPIGIPPPVSQSKTAITAHREIEKLGSRRDCLMNSAR
jgi:hypothetical protein